MSEAIALEMLLDKLRADRPIKLSRVIKSKIRFSTAPLTAEELSEATIAFCYTHDTQVTEYQYRALAVLDDAFSAYACKKYPPEDTCIWTIDEFKPMFNEIHRGVAHFVKQGLSVRDALYMFIRGKDFLNTVEVVE